MSSYRKNSPLAQRVMPLLCRSSLNWENRGRLSLCRNPEASKKVERRYPQTSTKNNCHPERSSRRTPTSQRPPPDNLTSAHKLVTRSAPRSPLPRTTNPPPKTIVILSAAVEGPPPPNDPHLIT